MRYVRTNLHQQTNQQTLTVNSVHIDSLVIDPVWTYVETCNYYPAHVSMQVWKKYWPESERIHNLTGNSSLLFVRIRLFAVNPPLGTSWTAGREMRGRGSKTMDEQVRKICWLVELDYVSRHH